jgi:3-oxoacyl-[acyl-carrier protein] reductase
MKRKVCVLTGSWPDIGAATTRQFAGNGWNVVVNYSQDAAPAALVADACHELGAEVIVVKADLSGSSPRKEA